MKQWKLSGNGYNLIYLFAGVMILFGVGNAALMANHKTLGDVWPLLIPVVFLVGYVAWRSLRSATLSIEGTNLVINRGSRKEYPFKEIKLTYGRFTYPNMGAFGTVLFVHTPKKTFRFAVSQLLYSAEVYTEADGYSYDFMMTEEEGKALAEGLAQALKNNSMLRAEPFRGGISAENQSPKPLTGGYGEDFDIQLQKYNGPFGQIFRYMGGMFGLVIAVNVLIFALEPLFGMFHAQFISMALFIPALLYWIFSIAKGDKSQYSLQLEAGRLTLYAKNKIEAQCTREEARIERAHYTVSGKGGSYTYPVLTISFPGKKVISFGGMTVSSWGKSGRDVGSPDYTIGPPEFVLLQKSFGIK